MAWRGLQQHLAVALTHNPSTLLNPFPYRFRGKKPQNRSGSRTGPRGTPSGAAAATRFVIFHLVCATRRRREGRSRVNRLVCLFPLSLLPDGVRSGESGNVLRSVSIPMGVIMFNLTNIINSNTYTHPQVCACVCSYACACV